MRLALGFVCLCMAQYVFAQSSSPNSDFNFGIFGGGSNAGGTPTSQTPGLVSANPLATNNGGLQQSGGLTQNGMPTGMQNTGLTQNSGMMNGGQTGMMNPTGMAMPGQNGMQNGMMGNGMQNGMMQNGMQNGMMGNGMQNGMMQNGMQNGMMQNGMQNGMMQNGMQNGMMQNGMMQNGMQNGMMQNGMMQNGMQNGMMQNGMMQNGMVSAGGMNFQDPTSMSSFNGNNLNQFGFDPNSQANLFQNQLNAQNMPQFGQQTQFGQGQFGMSPFGPQMPFATPFGAQFGSPFTSRPGFGMFSDPMMNAFAPNPFQMSASPMMGVGPMGSVFMPGMEMSNMIFDASGNVIGTTGGMMQTSGLTQGTGGLTQASGNSFVFPQPTQTMLPVANGIALPGGFGSTTLTANPGILGIGQLSQTQGLMQGGLMPQANAGQLQGMQMSTGGGSAQGLLPPPGGAGLLSNTLSGQGLNSNIQSINSNTNAFSSAIRTQAARTNSFALNNQGMSVNTNIEPFSGIVPNQIGTVLKNPDVNAQKQSVDSLQSGNPNSWNSNLASTNSVNSGPGLLNAAGSNIKGTRNGLTKSPKTNAMSSNVLSGK